MRAAKEKRATAKVDRSCMFTKFNLRPILRTTKQECELQTKKKEPTQKLPVLKDCCTVNFATRRTSMRAANLFCKERSRIRKIPSVMSWRIMWIGDSFYGPFSELRNRPEVLVSNLKGKIYNPKTILWTLDQFCGPL